MVSAPEERDPSREEEEGGPVKTFLEHLEDLRWTLIKSISALVIAMLVCLMAAKYLVAFLVWPLQIADVRFHSNKGPVPLLLGTNLLGKVEWKGLGLTNLATNQVTAVQLVPVESGTNLLMALQLDTKPLPPETDRMVIIKNYSPIEGIVVAMKLALYGGLVLALPFILLFVGQFVLPALKVNEKRILYKAVGAGTLLFLIGVAFCYFIVVVFALGATVQFSQWLGFQANEWRADAYLNFVCKFMLGLGLAFELPVILLTLVKIGLLSYEQLAGFRSYALVGNMVIAAVVTPSGDPVTMMILAVPLHMLYEISVFIAWMWKRKEAAEEATRVGGHAPT